jgi:hypothetical protein
VNGLCLSTKGEADKRIKLIRMGVCQERAALSTLRSQLSDLKDLLTPCSDLLDDVDHFFLDPKTLAEPRFPRDLERWLDQAVFVLQRAIQQREYVEEFVRKYGPNARVISAADDTVIPK